VLYIPSAAALTAGGYFQPRPGGGGWDTPLAAQHILKSVYDAHREALGGLRADGGAAGAGSAGGSLLDVAVRGLSAGAEDGAAAVAAALALRDGLIAAASSRPVLFAVDNYNCLYWRTEYGTAVSPRHRRALAVEELPLAASFRLAASADLGAASALCAVSHSRGVSPRVPLPLAPRARRYHVPRYSEGEAAAALAYYHRRAGGEPPSAGEVRRMYALTNGNGAELRRLSVQTTML